MATLKANGGVIKKWVKLVPQPTDLDVPWLRREYALCTNGVVLRKDTIGFRADEFNSEHSHCFGWEKCLNATAKLVQRKESLEKQFKETGYVAT